MADCLARGRVSLVAILLVFLLFTHTFAPVKADTLHNESSITIPASQAVFRATGLEAGEGMAGWFRILDGDGIRFFIVNSTGHNETQSSGIASISYKEAEYALREDQEWLYWNFTAPYTDVWYAYFSNTAPMSYPNEDEISIVINTETESPVIVAPAISGKVWGIISLPFTAIDDSFPIDRVELYVDGIIHNTVFNEEEATGVRFESEVDMNTTQYGLGLHFLSLKAYDVFGRVSKTYDLGAVEVAFQDSILNIIVRRYPIQLSMIPLILILAILVSRLSMMRRRRVLSHLDE